MKRDRFRNDFRDAPYTAGALRGLGTGGAAGLTVLRYRPRTALLRLLHLWSYFSTRSLAVGCTGPPPPNEFICPGPVGAASGKGWERPCAQWGL